MIEDSFKFAAEDVSARKLIEARQRGRGHSPGHEESSRPGRALADGGDLTAIRAALAAFDRSRRAEDHKAIRARIKM